MSFATRAVTRLDSLPQCMTSSNGSERHSPRLPLSRGEWGLSRRACSQIDLLNLTVPTRSHVTLISLFIWLWKPSKRNSFLLSLFKIKGTSKYIRIFSILTLQQRQGQDFDFYCISSNLPKMTGKEKSLDLFPLILVHVFCFCLIYSQIQKCSICAYFLLDPSQRPN